jgi:DNA ligase (NAD+)
MEGFGEKSYENLISAISAAGASVLRARLLNSLGIPGIGTVNARVICRAFAYDWDRISGASREELVLIDGIGEVLADGYASWWADDKNLQALRDILDMITLDPDEESAAQSSGEGEGAKARVAGLTFVITGSLESYANREELKERLEDAGAKVTGSVSEKTDYLINNDVDSPSSKNKKAKKLGVKIIKEAEVNAMLEDKQGAG